MKFDIKKLLKSIEPAKNLLIKNSKLLVILTVLILFGFVFYRIAYFNSLAPSEESIDEKLNNLQRPRIDKDLVKKLENLEHDNIQVQSLFNQARENPFNE